MEYDYGMSSSKLKDQLPTFRPNSYLPVDVGVRPQSIGRLAMDGMSSSKNKEQMITGKL